MRHEPLMILGRQERRGVRRHLRLVLVIEELFVLRRSAQEHQDLRDHERLVVLAAALEELMHLVVALDPERVGPKQPAVHLDSVRERLRGLSV